MRARLSRHDWLNFDTRIARSAGPPGTQQSIVHWANMELREERALCVRCNAFMLNFANTTLILFADRIHGFVWCFTCVAS